MLGARLGLGELVAAILDPMVARLATLEVLAAAAVGTGTMVPCLTMLGETLGLG